VALKDKPKAQMMSGLNEVMEPGEQIQAATTAMRGPSPWLVGGLLGVLFTKQYWVAVTDRRVLAVRMRKTGEVLFSDPRASVRLSEASPHSVYSKLAIQRSDGTVIRFRVHRMWREEFDRVVTALGGGVPAA
jgi:hypothetical protein